MKLLTLADTAGKLLVSQKLTLSVCESCTGGMLGSIVTSIPGSSRYFLGGIIAYDNSIKHDVVGVPLSTIEERGTVSAEVAEKMAWGTRVRLNSDICISITGIAGPGGGGEDKPVGLVFICIAKQDVYRTRRYRFTGKRRTIRESACEAALELLIEALNGSL